MCQLVQGLERAQCRAPGESKHTTGDALRACLHLNTTWGHKLSYSCPQMCLLTFEKNLYNTLSKA